VSENEKERSDVYYSTYYYSLSLTTELERGNKRGE